MRSSKYNYLKQYVNQNKGNYKINFENCFWSLNNINEIEESEKRLNTKLPKLLKEFWSEIGIGHLTIPHNAPVGFECGPNNEFLGPSQIADIMLLKEKSGLILPDAPMVEGAIPFFEIADCYDFLVMLPERNNPDAVYDQYGYLVEKDLETFIHRLYYESPTYYLKINNQKK